MLSVANGESIGALERAFEPKKFKVVYADLASTAGKSELQRDRSTYEPKLPGVLRGPHVLTEGDERHCVRMDQEDSIKSRFPHLCSHPMRMVQFQNADSLVAPVGSGAPLRIAVVLSGGQAAGGHNVIVGVFDYLTKWHPGSTLFGFLKGPKGVLDNKYIQLTKEIIDKYRNQGGFHMIGSGRDKIETPQQLAAAEATATQLGLDGLIVIGGDDSNTNSALLAEYFLQKGLKTKVVGCPKTIDGDLKNSDVAISFGFDTACKVYSELIGNIMVDAASAGKYFHFIRLMGRSASHITLECALQTHPQMAFVSEEVAANKLCLHDLAVQIADMVEARVATGKNYGVVLIPEGLIECVHDVSELISVLPRQHPVLADQPPAQPRCKAQADQKAAAPAPGLWRHLPHRPGHPPRPLPPP